MVVAGANSAGSGDQRTTANTSVRCCGRSPDRATAFDRYGLTVRAIEAAGREICGRGLVRCCGRSLTEPLRLTGTVSAFFLLRTRGWRPAVRKRCGVRRPAHNKDPRTTAVFQVQLIPVS